MARREGGTGASGMRWVLVGSAARWAVPGWPPLACPLAGGSPSAVHATSRAVVKPTAPPMIGA